MEYGYVKKNAQFHTCIFISNISQICRILKTNAMLSFIPLFSGDNVPKDSDTVKNADVTKVEETGKDRVKRMFTIDEYESISPEISSIVQVACMSSFVGAVYGGLISSRTAYMDFVANNQATTFANHFDAKKQLQDKVTISFAKGAFRWGWRLSLFSTTYMTVQTVVSVYRGKFGILEHVAAGTAAGFAYKLPSGPRAWIVGSGLGCVLGTIAGTLTYSVLTLAGMSMQDVRYWQYQWKESRRDSERELIQNHMETEDVIVSHNLKIGAVGKDINVIKLEENVKK